MSSIYTVNKGINREIEFKGLRGQYILYMAIGLVGLLLLFAICYIAGLSTYICIALVGILGFALYTTVYRLNHKYGTYGLMKWSAYKMLPEAVVASSRQLFTSLKRN